MAHQRSIPAGLGRCPPVGPPGGGLPGPHGPSAPSGPGGPSRPRGAAAREGQKTQEDAADDALWPLSWNLRYGLVPPDRSLRERLRRRQGLAACTDKEHLITSMLSHAGGFAIILQETGIATRAQEMHVAAALKDKGYTPFFS